VSEELPAPRGDEPSGLRQDIADELGDHLQCALRRESLDNSDENEARESVLKKFGDPRRIARRLWLDAMQERIMSQRITLALAALVTIVCLLALGIVWRVAEDSRAANLALVDGVRAANDALMSKLENLSDRGARAANLDWKETRVRVVQGEPGGSAVETCTLTLVGTSEQWTGLTLTKTTDSDGVADFGLLHVGRYSLNVMTPWGERGTQYLFVVPHSTVHEIVCPAQRPEHQLAFQVDWPADLRNRNLYVFAQLSSEQNQFGVADEWSFPWQALLISDSGEICTGSLLAQRFSIEGFIVSESCQGSMGVQASGVKLVNACIVTLNEPPAPSAAPLPLRRVSSDYVAFPEFEVRSQDDNVWVLNIPEITCEQVRTQLSADSES
jgi:hypothetical protein